MKAEATLEDFWSREKFLIKYLKSQIDKNSKYNDGKRNSYQDLYYKLTGNKYPKSYVPIDEVNSDMKTPEELVQAFAESMRVELEANKHKGDWQTWDDINEMFEELGYHLCKLAGAIEIEDKDRIKEHTADCGNYLLMIGNKYKVYDDI